MTHGLDAAHLVMDRQQQLAAKQFAECRRTLKAHQQQLLDLQRYREEYRQRLNADSLVRRGQSLQQFHRFIIQLERGIEQQRQTIIALEKQCEEKRQLWLQAHHKVKAVENLRQRQRLHEQAKADRREQKAADEISLRSRFKP